MWKFIVPALGLIVVIVVGMVVTTGQSDSATGASSADKMLKVDLPTGLPVIVREAGNGGDATADYVEAIRLYMDKADFLRSNPPPKDMIDELVTLVERAGKSGSVQKGWADKYAPLTPGAQPRWYEAPKAIAKIIVDAEVYSQVSGGELTGSKHRARKATDAAYLFGKRVYEGNSRVLIRRDGLRAMEVALAARELALGDKDAAKWRDSIGPVMIKWEQKLAALYKYDASIADIVRFAELDQDPGFRVEAILQLGVAQWTQRSRGNARVATAALESLKGSKNAMIAEAAKAAAAIERKDVHKAY